MVRPDFQAIARTLAAAPTLKAAVYGVPLVTLPDPSTAGSVPFVV